MQLHKYQLKPELPPITSFKHLMALNCDSILWHWWLDGGKLNTRQRKGEKTYIGTRPSQRRDNLKVKVGRN